VQLDISNQEDSKTGRVGIPGHPVLKISGKNGQILSTSVISFLIVNYVTKLHVGLVGFVSLGTAAWVQFDRSNQEDSKTGWVGIPRGPVL
jgi:hypothetical protein